MAADHGTGRAPLDDDEIAVGQGLVAAAVGIAAHDMGDIAANLEDRIAVASGKHGGKGGSAVGIVTDAAAIDDDAVVGGVGDAAVTPAAEGLHGLTAVIDDRAVAGPGTVAIGHDAVDIAVGIAHPDLGVVVMGRSVEVGARCRTRGQQEQAHKADQGEPGGELTVVEEGERGHGASWRHRD